MPVRSLWCKIINQCLYEKKKKEQKSGHNERILSLINNRKYFVGFNTLSLLYLKWGLRSFTYEAHSMKLIIIMWNCETPIGIFDQPFKIGPPCKECPSYIVSLWMMLTHAIYFWTFTLPSPPRLRRRLFAQSLGEETLFKKNLFPKKVPSHQHHISRLQFLETSNNERFWPNAVLPTFICSIKLQKV